MINEALEWMKLLLVTLGATAGLLGLLWWVTAREKNEDEDEEEKRGR